MRRSDRQITDIVEIESLLNDAQVRRIGMSDGVEPYIRFVLGTLTEQFTIIQPCPEKKLKF